MSQHEIAWAVNHGTAWPVPIRPDYEKKLEMLEQIRQEIRPKLTEKRRAELRLNRIGKQKTVPVSGKKFVSAKTYSFGSNNMENLVIQNGGEFFVKGMDRAAKDTREDSKRWAFL